MSMRLLLRPSPSVLAVLVLVAWIVRADADSGDTLRLVQERGVLGCGVSEGVIGFSVRDAAGA
jgi:general L-amino acid transport system substrate-binding protein